MASFFLNFQEARDSYFNEGFFTENAVIDSNICQQLIEDDEV